MDELTAALRERMKNMTSDERIALIRQLIDGYCRACGGEDPNCECRCWDDE